MAVWRADELDGGAVRVIRCCLAAVFAAEAAACKNAQLLSRFDDLSLEIARALRVRRRRLSFSAFLGALFGLDFS
jgi:hypothetical protein